MPAPPRRLGRLSPELVRAVASCLDAGEVDPLAWAWVEKLRRFVELSGALLPAVAADRFGHEEWRRTLGAMALLLAKAAAAGRVASPEGLPDLAHLNAALRALEAAGRAHAGLAESLVMGSLAAARSVVRGRLPPAPGGEIALPQAPVGAEARAAATKPFRIVLIGRPGSHHTATSLQLLRAAGLTVAGLVAVARPARRSLAFRLRAAPLGGWGFRHRTATPPLQRLARALGLARPGLTSRLVGKGTPLLQVASLADPALSGLLERVLPDAVVYSGGGIVPQAVIARAGLGVVNAHNALLPGYRGLDAPAWALLEGRLDAIGVTGHLMDASIDTGPILRQRPVDVAGFATLPVLETELWRLMPAMLTEATLALRNGATAKPQATDTRQYFHLHGHLRALVPEAMAVLGSRR